jgi:hypothetical protein
MHEGETEFMCGFVGKAKRKETTRKSKGRVGDNIKMDLREIGWCGMDWIRLAQDRDSCEHGNEPLDSLKCREILAYLSDWQLLKKDLTQRS